MYEYFLPRVVYLNSGRPRRGRRAEKIWNHRCCGIRIDHLSHPEAVFYATVFVFAMFFITGISAADFTLPENISTISEHFSEKPLPENVDIPPSADADERFSEKAGARFGEGETDLPEFLRTSPLTAAASGYKVPTLTDDARMTYPRATPLANLTVSAGKRVSFRQGAYEVHVLEGDCELRQGNDGFRARRMVIWEDRNVSYENAADFGMGTDAGEVEEYEEYVNEEEYSWMGGRPEENVLPVHRVLMYLEGDAEIVLVTPKTTSRVKDRKWSGRLYTLNPVSIRVGAQRKYEDKSEFSENASAETRTLYENASAYVFRDVDVILTQWTSGGAQPAYGESFGPPAGSSLGSASDALSFPLEGSPVGGTPRSGDYDLRAESYTDRPGEYGRPTTEPPGVLIPPSADDLSRFRGEFPSGRLTPDAISASLLSQGDVSALDPNAPPPGMPSVSIYPRSDVPLTYNWSLDKQTGQWICIIDGGANVIIEGVDRLLSEHVSAAGRILGRNEEAESIGTIDISTDRLVLWLPAGQQTPVMQGNSFMKNTVPPEIYMEGNIIFRQGDREIHADRMYFDVYTKRGIIREAEIFATVPKASGLIRLRAEEIRVPEEGVFVAKDAFVTTSRMGDPIYRFQMGRMMLRSERHPKTDPRTGLAVIDPVTGQQVMETTNELSGTDTFVKVGNVPLFYWRQFNLPLERPSTIINKISLRNDSIFGFQPIIGVDAYRLFGVRRPWSGTDWDLYGSYYTKRGPGLGTKFLWNRPYENLNLGWFSGPGFGFVDFWGIYDMGHDNLGEGRRRLNPETKWRYHIIGKHKSVFGDDFQLKAQLGIISDRNFQQAYFQRAWYTESDAATQIEIRKEDQNRSWSLWADLRTNDFHTQTQRTPQGEFYWIGQPLFWDVLTWSSYSQVGYVHMYPDTYPTDPADRALFNLLSWETGGVNGGPRTPRQGFRASTRHEISYPFQAGVVKIVPYVLGELAAWGEDLSGDSAQRAYGQMGIRASLPMWRHFDFNSTLLNVRGIMHKVEFDVEASYSAASIHANSLPLYDMIDDRQVLDFRHHMQNAVFGGNPIPWKFDARSYAVRSNLGGWVTSPSTELADDLVLIRFGMHHRWQTKRGMPGQQRIVDWITLDVNMNLYPDANRDNFGCAVGLLDYDFRYHVGDRLTLFSSGCFDFFSNGLKIVDIGAIINRPGSGSFFTSFHFLSGPVDNVVMRVGYNYWMSEKWASTLLTTFDISGKGNIGQSLSVTRIGESMLWTLGVSYDNPSDNFGVFFNLEPRFGKMGSISRQLGIPPPGMRGLD